MKRITVGILAHVDAGKTTCIESMLYHAGNIKKLGRVDHQDAFLDYDDQERDRGITIYAKEAKMNWKDHEIYLIDTPGHIDFSSEMERSLKVLDLAVLLINGQDGVQSHTQTIWDCLKQYNVPTLIFVNKMDISHYDQDQLLRDLKEKLHENCILYDDLDSFAMVNESLMNEYLENNTIPTSLQQQAVFSRECFPVYFGSALKNQNIDLLLDGINTFSLDKEYPHEFGAKVYKITSDEQGHTLAHIKMTGGMLHAKEKISEDEKVDQIRLYNGEKFDMLQEAQAGMVVTLKGLSNPYIGQGFGFEEDDQTPLLLPYLDYELVLPRNIDEVEMMKHLDSISKEDPNLHIQYDEQKRKITLQLMGDIQMEVLQKKIFEQTNIQVGFSSGSVIFKETIAESVNGVGHFEPLRHYAEVHVRLDPLKRGSGIQFGNECSSDTLAPHWQNLILRHFEERQHRGVLTRSVITDMKITLIAGKGHLKHTQGGDFRQATYRAIRQGLKKADSILLEPYYSFTLEVPNDCLSKALYDLEQKRATVEVKNDTTIVGKGPIRHMMNYQNEVLSYTKGQGKFFAQLDGYQPCQEQDKIVEAIGYDSESDLRNPTGSVFCEHGSGFYVPYDEVESYMHIQPEKETSTQSYQTRKYTISQEEAQRVFNMQNGRNRNEKKKPKQKKKKEIETTYINVAAQKPQCLIIDGYNQLYGWSSLKELAHSDFQVARERLIDMISNYQGYRNIRVILVFDAYRVKESSTRNEKRGHLEIVYTKYSQTADSYIERLVHDMRKDYNLIVASSDGLIQNSILAQGAKRMSATELEGRVRSVNQNAFKSLHEKGSQ